MHCLDGAEVIHNYFTFGLSLVDDSASIMVLMSFSSVLTSDESETSSIGPMLTSKSKSLRNGCIASQNSNDIMGSFCWEPFSRWYHLITIYKSRLTGVGGEIEAVKFRHVSWRRSRRMLLKLVKSSLTMELPTWSSFTYRRIAWTAASAPPATPTPTCLGCRTLLRSSMTCRLAHSATNLLMVYPTAIGRTPPYFLYIARRRPPKMMVSRKQVSDMLRRMPICSPWRA